MNPGFTEGISDIGPKHFPLKKRSAILILLTGLALYSCNRDPVIQRFEHGVELVRQKTRIRFTFYDSNIVAVSKIPVRSSHDRENMTILALPRTVDLQAGESADTLIIKTRALKIKMNQSTGRIIFTDAENNTVLKEGDWLISTANAGEDTDRISQHFTTGPDEGYYGLGQYHDAVMNYRGREVLVSQSNMDAVNPYLVSTAGYGILWDNYAQTVFASSGDTIGFTSSPGKGIRYFLVAGKTMDQAISGYRTLTGKPPLFGKWAYGYWQSKEHYHTREEVLETATEYRRRGIPIDNIVQDWSYWGDQSAFNAMQWDSVRYPDPKGMIDSLHKMDFHFMAVIWPAFGPRSEIHRKMDSLGFLFPKPHWSGSRVYDAWNPAARDLYWEYVKKGLYDIGVDAYWMDGTEPEFRSTGDRFITAGSILENDSCHSGDLENYLNAYSLNSTRGIYEHQRIINKDKRVFILTRSAFSGQQAWGATTWSGDIFASWGTFNRQVRAGLNFCMSGIPYWTSDIGGFITRLRYPDALRDPAYKELYVRWFQFGAFCPVFRAHGTDIPREIWQFGEPGDPFYDALLRADVLRYRLLPYIYSLARMVTGRDYTMMRSLVMDFPEDPVIHDFPTQYMFGPGIMVCPVNRALYHRNEQIQEFIPSYLIRSPGGERQGAELEFFTDTGMSNSVYERKSDVLKLSWSGDLPPVLEGHPYTARWSGTIRVKDPGKYTFLIRSNGGVHFVFDGKTMVKASANGKQTMYRTVADLAPYTLYSFSLVNHQPEPDQANILLEWITPDQKQRMRLPRNKNLQVYLPGPGDWYDFWTGRRYGGGNAYPAAAPLDIIPLFVPEGTILPMGDKIRHAMEKNNDIELRIYPGKDGHFTLYDDAGDGYQYEKGEYSLIPVEWKDSENKLVLGERNGSFEGMSEEIRFHIVVVRENHGTGTGITVRTDKTLTYTGEAMETYPVLIQQPIE